MNEATGQLQVVDDADVKKLAERLGFMDDLQLTQSQFRELRNFIGVARMRAWADGADMTCMEDERDQFLKIIGLDPDEMYRSISFDWEPLKNWLHQFEREEERLRLARSTRKAAWLSVVLGVLAIVLV
jgi:hypothetical protein